MITAHTNNVQIIEHEGKPAFAVIPWDEYQTMIDSVYLDESNVWFPHEVVNANLRGDSLIKAWREYHGMTQAGLAANAGITQPALARIERPDATPRKSSLAKLAAAMGITVEQLIE